MQVSNPEGAILALKLHRLGRTSFRAVRSKRDYLRRGHHFSWLYLSRLAAVKEHAFMTALGARGVRVPAAYGQNRHAVLMELIDGVQLAQARTLAHLRCRSPRRPHLRAAALRLPAARNERGVHTPRNSDGKRSAIQLPA